MEGKLRVLSLSAARDHAGASPRKRWSVVGECSQAFFYPLSKLAALSLKRGDLLVPLRHELCNCQEVFGERLRLALIAFAP